MRTIRLEKISKQFHGEQIIENLDLTIPGGKFFALLGPSGSGKTTILRLIAGFEKPDNGRIFLGSTDITEMPINERRINTVFQNYALFPHMNVYENVAYSLRIAKLPQELIEQKVVKSLKAVHLEKHMYRPVTQLSGGQQQRVAIARATINSPDVLLLDEPLAALDLKSRERMLIELIELQSSFETTFVYVTHDQFEALTVADQLAIMNTDGEVEQIGTPKAIYEFPVSAFVARFVGTTNIFEGSLSEHDGKHVFILSNLGPFEIMPPVGKNWDNKKKLYMSLRPEKIDISKSELAGFSNRLTGTVEAIIYQGRSTQYNVKLANGFRVHVFEQNEEHFPHEVIDYDDQVFLYWQKENVVLLER